VLLGPSGCGKTTLLRMIAGLLEPSSGHIYIDGEDVVGVAPKERNLAMVFQSYALYPHLSVEKNLEFPLRVLKLDKQEARARIERVAAQLGLDQLLQRKPKELSGGQRQRVAVGRALVREPRAYLMDEPLSNLDAKLRTATRQELTQLHGRLDATFIYVTHDQVEAMTMATKIVVLNQGRIEQVGSPTEVYDAPDSVFVAGFLGSPPMNLLPARLSGEGGWIVAKTDHASVRLFPGDTAEHEIVLGVRPEHVELEREDSALHMSGVVETVENLGNEQVAYVRVGEHLVIARVGRDVPLVRGRQVRLGAAADRIHLFDRASGRRMSWVPDSLPQHAEALVTASA